jgi:hypothetical protein
MPPRAPIVARWLAVFCVWVGFYPFTLVESGRMTMGELVFLLGLVPRLIGAALMLVAVIYLGKTRTRASATA